mgnify:FL=1
MKKDKHKFIFVTDLDAHAEAYRTAWTLWLDLVGKEKDDYSINIAQAMTHIGLVYVIYVAIQLTKQEFESFQEMT